MLYSSSVCFISRVATGSLDKQCLQTSTLLFSLHCDTSVTFVKSLNSFRSNKASAEIYSRNKVKRFSTFHKPKEAGRLEVVGQQP